MANYTIIGGDGKQYGPITGEDLRKWISEGRLNAQSLAKADSDAEFRTLATFPEFADVFGAGAQTAGAPPPLNPANIGGREAALRKIKVPAVALIVTAILNLILALWSLVDMIFSSPDQQQINSELAQVNSLLAQLNLNNPQIEEFVQKLFHLMYGPQGIVLGIVNVLVELAISVLVLVGAKKMKSLQSYEFALAAATLSTVPCLTPCCGYVLGLAFGIWALVVLRKPDVKSQFS